MYEPVLECGWDRMMALSLLGPVVGGLVVGGPWTGLAVATGVSFGIAAAWVEANSLFDAAWTAPRVPPEATVRPVEERADPWWALALVVGVGAIVAAAVTWWSIPPEPVVVGPSVFVGMTVASRPLNRRGLAPIEADRGLVLVGRTGALGRRELRWATPERLAAGRPLVRTGA